MTIVFKFDLDEIVKTDFGETGKVVILGFDDGGIKYFVETKHKGSWYKEKDLS